MTWTWLSCVCLAALAGSVSAQTVAVRDEPDRVILHNERFELAVGKAQKGGLVSLIDRRSGREMVAQQAWPRLFTLALTARDSDGRQRTYVSSTDAGSVDFTLDGEAGTQRLRMRFHNLGGRGIECTCSAAVREGDPYVRWRLEEVRLPEGLALEEAQFPFIVLRAPLQEGQEDLAVLGHTKGGVHHRPGAWKVGQAAGATQPGWMCAQFGSYYDAAAGLYTAAEDAKGYPKSLWLRRAQEGMEVAWSAPCFASETFALDYDVVLTTFAGSDPGTPTDWRDAADLYKAWAEKQPWCAKRLVERADVPQWLKSGPAMVRFGRDWLAQPDSIERWLNDYWLKRFRPKTPLIVAYWGWEKVQYWVTPDYFPVFPSDEVFTGIAKMNRRIGGHVFPWPSGYHYTLMYGAREDGTFEWDDRERFAREAEPHAVVNRDDTTWLSKPSWLKGGENSCMCPGDPWTIDWWNRTCEQLVERGADMLQVDQVVGGRFPPCYSPKHGHPPGPGLWMAEVFRMQLETMLQRCRKINPQAVVCFEEPNEHFIQQAFIQDYRDLEPPWSGPAPERASVFNYVYHEYLPTFQSNPRAGDRRTQAYCLANGEIPHFVPSRDIGPGPFLSNGGFEEWRGDVPVGWDRVGGWQGETWNGRCFRDDQEKHGGECSVRLESTEGDTVQVSRNLNFGETLRIGGTYRLSAWMKSRELAKPNNIMLGAITWDIKSKGGWQLPMPSPEEGWVRREATFTVPAGADFLRIMMHVSGRGVVWVDDMLLEEIAPDGTAREVSRPEVPPEHDLMRQWVDLFAGEGRPYLEHGRMLHPPKLEVEGNPEPEGGMPVVMHNAFRAPDGSEAVVIVNAADVPHTANLTWQGRERTLGLGPWEVRLVK
ncbi:MAG: hypothetical protein FJX75_16620 [Armatimonadetes bacterium]|nr:hypothetical protein [Armatimonadota bacterium]